MLAARIASANGHGIYLRLQAKPATSRDFRTASPGDRIRERLDAKCIIEDIKKASRLRLCTPSRNAIDPATVAA